MKLLPEFLFKKKEKKHWRELGTVLQPFMRDSYVAQLVIAKANELGLKGQKIQVTVVKCNFDSGLDELWFEGETL